VPDEINEPYIERPDEHQVTGDQLFCWIVWNRECGGDCVSFEEQATVDPRMTTCKVLNTMRSVALSFAHAAQSMAAFQQTTIQAEKARSREELRERIKDLPPPPKVHT